MTTLAKRYTEAHDDIRVLIRSSLAGATQWIEEVITGTSFVAGCLRNNSTDYFQFHGEPQHKRQLGSLLADFHYHYILQAAAVGASETLVYNVFYCWLNPGDAMPADASWTNAGTITQTLTGTPAVRTYGIFAFTANINPPANEAYGSMLFVRVVRGNGTYLGNVAIIDAGAHTKVDRMGSLNPSND